jgi:hypothetical protein
MILNPNEITILAGGGAIAIAPLIAQTTQGFTMPDGSPWLVTGGGLMVIAGGVIVRIIRAIKEKPRTPNENDQQNIP